MALGWALCGVMMSPVIIVTAHHDVSPHLAKMARVESRPISSAQEAVSMRHSPSPVAILNGDGTAADETQPEIILSRNFEGINDHALLPDTNGDVGPFYYFQVVNRQLAVFAKTGLLLYGPVSEQTPWQGFAGLCADADSGDPLVVYDALAARWVLTRMVGTEDGSGSRECVAVSQTDDPLGQWYRYEFAFDGEMIDYPKLAVWPSGYIMTSNSFPRLVCALDRARMLLGEDASAQCFTTDLTMPLPADLDGARLPPRDSPAYIVDAVRGANTLGIYKLSIDWAIP